MTTSYYKPSGRLTFNFFLLYILLMVVSIPVLSYVYIYLVHYIPFIYANFFISVFCGMGTGYLIGIAVKKGRARNPAVVVVMTLAATCVLYYVQWCVYIPLVASEVYGFTMTFGERFFETLYYFMYPGDVYEAAMIINEFGAWTLNDAEITGGFLLFIWIAEFIIIAVCAIIMSNSQATNPYSEENDDWYVPDSTVDIDIIPDFDTVKEDLEAGRYADFIQHAVKGCSGGDDYQRLTFFRSPEDTSSEPYYMNIDQSKVENTGRKKNKGKIKAKNLLKYIIIDSQSAKEIIAGAATSAAAAYDREEDPDETDPDTYEPAKTDPDPTETNE